MTETTHTPSSNNPPQFGSHGWLEPQWPAPAWLGAVMTTRASGYSQAPYNSMNLGDHVGDAPDQVAANRAHLQRTCAMQSVFLQQVHGAGVVRLDSGLIQASHAPQAPALQADACFTTEPGLACSIMVADCLPVLLVHTQARIVGAAHAGWRGLAGQQGHGVLEALLQAMRAALPDAMCAGTCPPTSADTGWQAWLGPSISAAAFEVGDEVRAAFMQTNPAAQTCFTPAAQSGKWLANLPALARQRLAALGVSAVYGNDGSLPWCTWSQPETFFSYRRNNHTGRMAAAVWIKPPTPPTPTT